MVVVVGVKLLAGWSIDIHIKREERNGDRMAKSGSLPKKDDGRYVCTYFSLTLDGSSDLYSSLTTRGKCLGTVWRMQNDVFLFVYEGVAGEVRFFFSFGRGQKKKQEDAQCMK